MTSTVAPGTTSPLPSGEGSGVGLIRFAPHPIYDTYGDPVDKAAARKQLNLPEAAPFVLFFGFIRKYKGLDLLLEALNQTPDIHAIVAGECYEDWAPYQKIITEYHLSGRVHLFTDFIPYRAGSALLFSGRSGGTAVSLSHTKRHLANCLSF